jgi:hypothetical protein
MRIRNARVAAPFVMFYRTCPLPAIRSNLAAAGSP